MAARSAGRTQGKRESYVAYVAVVGIEWQDDQGQPRRAEPGDAVPADVVQHARWLLTQGLVRAGEPEEIEQPEQVEQPEQREQEGENDGA